MTNIIKDVKLEFQNRYQCLLPENRIRNIFNCIFPLNNVNVDKNKRNSLGVFAKVEKGEINQNLKTDKNPKLFLVHKSVIN